MFDYLENAGDRLDRLYALRAMLLDNAYDLRYDAARLDPVRETIAAVSREIKAIEAEIGIPAPLE